MPELKPLYIPKSDDMPMRVALMMSGSGTNTVKIIEHAIAFLKRIKPMPYEPAIIFSENPESNAKEIGNKFGIETIVKPLEKKDPESREEFDVFIHSAFNAFYIDVVALAGYNWFVSPIIHDNRITVNVHPADLRPLKEDGKRKYAGGIGHVPVMNAIKAGEQYLHSTTHTVTEVRDGGSILMVSDGVQVILPDGMTLEELMQEQNKELFEKVGKEHQNRLKEYGDWKIFPKTLELIAQQRYATDENNLLYFDGKPIPNGIEFKEVA